MLPAQPAAAMRQGGIFALLLIGAPFTNGANSSASECTAESTAGSILETIRLRGGAGAEERVANPVVLFIGDSMAEFAGTSLAVFCRGCTILNRGIGGSMTTDWTMPKLLEVAESLPEGFMPSHIWLSIGGNDYLERHRCQTSSMAQLQAEIMEVAQNLRSLIPPAVKILLTGCKCCARR